MLRSRLGQSTPSMQRLNKARHTKSTYVFAIVNGSCCRTQQINYSRPLTRHLHFTPHPVVSRFSHLDFTPHPVLRPFSQRRAGGHATALPRPTQVTILCKVDQQRAPFACQTEKLYLPNASATRAHWKTLLQRACQAAIPSCACNRSMH